ncbi:hypothetical protein R6Q57_011457 [Mikania cordata]
MDMTPRLTIDQIVTQQTNNDDRVNPSQFKELVKRWFTPEFQTTCANKRSSRSKMNEPHITGTKSFARLAHEVTSLKVIESDSTSTVADRDDFTKDNYSKVKNPKKRGYVRLVGRMPATKGKGDSPSDSNIIHMLQSAVNVIMDIIHEHIPNANLSTVLSDMNIHAYRLNNGTVVGPQDVNVLAKLLCLLVPGQRDLLIKIHAKCRLPGYKPGCQVKNLAAGSPTGHFLYI